MKKIAFLAICILPTLSGCTTNYKNGHNTFSPYAVSAERFHPSYQQQLNASAHWSAIAEDLAIQLKRNLTTHSLNHKPVYLHLHSEDTTFTDAFNDFLTTHLVNQGVRVSKSPEKTIIYNYKIKPISYRSERQTQSYTVYDSELSDGVVVKRNLKKDQENNTSALGTNESSTPLLKTIAPKLELIIDSSILSNDIYLYKTTDVYYANNTDIHLYKKQSVSDRSSVFDDPFYQ